MGVLHDSPGFSLEDAQGIIAEREDMGMGFEFDYVFGRPLKVYAPDGVIGENSVRLYDRDAGTGAFDRAFEQAQEVACDTG